MIMNFAHGDVSCKKYRKSLRHLSAAANCLLGKTADCCSQEADFLISINYLKKRENLTTEWSLMRFFLPLGFLLLKYH